MSGRRGRVGTTAEPRIPSDKRKTEDEKGKHPVPATLKQLWSLATSYEPALLRPGDAGDHVSDPGCGSTALNFAVVISIAMAAPRSESAKSHAFRSKAKLRRARPTALLARQARPSSSTVAKPSHHLRM